MMAKLATLTGIPQEVVREIVELIDDIPTLRYGLLICKHVTSAFQERLFKEVQLHDKGESAVAGFSSIAKSSTYLLRKIRAFSINIPLDHDDNLALLVYILSHSNIRKLLVKEGHKHAIAKFTSESALTALSTILPKHRLEELHLYHVNICSFPYAHQCRNIKYLSLVDIHTYLPDANPPLLTHPEEKPVVLDTLQLWDHLYTLGILISWFLHPHCPFDIRNLKTLSFTDKCTPVQFMKRCATSLEALHMDLHAGSIHYREPHRINLSIFPNLHTLHIRGRISDGYRIQTIITETLHTIPYDSPIQTVLLDVVMTEEYYYTSNDLQWISGIFRGLRVFSGKRKAVVTFYIGTGGPRWLAEEINKMFKFKGRTYLEIDIRAEDSSGPFLKFSENEVPEPESNITFTSI